MCGDATHFLSCLISTKTNLKMDDCVRIWLVILAVTAVCLWWCMQRQSQRIDGIVGGLARAADALKTEVQRLKEELTQIEEKLRERAHALYIALKDKISAAKEHLKVLGEKAENLLKQIAAQAQADMSHLEDEISQLKGDIANALNLIQTEVLVPLCQNPSINTWLAQQHFSVIDPATCGLKSKWNTCPRGYYGGDFGAPTCQYMMCPGGSLENGINYQYNKGNDWCKAAYGEGSGCAPSVGLCRGADGSLPTDPSS